jgi:hypothetical protein
VIARRLDADAAFDVSVMASWSDPAVDDVRIDWAGETAVAP